MPDQESINGQLKLLETYRRRLRIQLDQQGRMGTFAPAYMQIEVDDARANIKKIKAYLHNQGLAVDDLPEDRELPAPPEPAPTKTTPPPPTQEPAATNERADVYISYHPADKPWVRGTLLPLIEQNGLRAIVDWRDFEIGVPKITNMENAVARSRQTLLVLTPEWVASEWNIFQELLSSSSDPAGVRGKLLPVMLRQCSPPARLAMREAADLTDPAERDEQLQRVVRALLGRAMAGDTAKPYTEPTNTIPPSPPTSADFVIVTALEEERDAMLAHLPGSQRIMPSQADVRTYRYARVPVAFPDGAQGSYGVAVLSLISMGRVEASLATADAIRRWQPRYVLMVGIAGGIEQAGVRVGDVLVSNQVIDYELQKVKAKGTSTRYSVHRAAPRLLDAAQNMPAADWHDTIKEARPDSTKPKRIVGPIATGDKVIARKAFLDQLLADWPKLIGVEMEAGGAAAAAFQAANSPGFFMIRGVSDLANEDKGSETVEQWRSYACNVAAAYTVALLKSGPVPLG